MELSIVFIRHAHRDTATRSEDNGIDEKGRSQVEELLKAFQLRKLPASQEFWSSPKKRCLETLEPLAQLNGAKIKIMNELDEQTNQESGKDFRERVSNFVHSLKEKSGVIYLCSHGDWLPEAIQDLSGLWVDMKKGQSVICEKTKTGWRLQ